MSKSRYVGEIGTTSIVPISPLYDFSKMKESDKSEIRNFCYQKEFLDLITQMFDYVLERQKLWICGCWNKF